MSDKPFFLFLCLPIIQVTAVGVLKGSYHVLFTLCLPFIKQKPANKTPTPLMRSQQYSRADTLAQAACSFRKPPETRFPHWGLFDWTDCFLSVTLGHPPKTPISFLFRKPCQPPTHTKQNLFASCSFNASGEVVEIEFQSNSRCWFGRLDLWNPPF